MRVYESKIDKERLSGMPLCSLGGKIIVVDEPSKVEFAVNVLREAGMIGFDTETRPSFVKGFRYRIALLQLSTAEVCFLFRLQLIGHNELLKGLIEDQSVVKIGISTHDDFHSLQTWMPCRPMGFVDLQHLVEHFGIEELSLQKIYAIVFGERISKSQQLSNWEAVPLSPAQQLYAAIDAWSCMRLFRQFQADDPDFVDETSRLMITGRLTSKKAPIAQTSATKPEKTVKKKKPHWPYRYKRKSKKNDNNNTQGA